MFKVEEVEIYPLLLSASLPKLYNGQIIMGNIVEFLKQG